MSLLYIICLYNEIYIYIVWYIIYVLYILFTICIHFSNINWYIYIFNSLYHIHIINILSIRIYIYTHYIHVCICIYIYICVYILCTCMWHVDTKWPLTLTSSVDGLPPVVYSDRPGSSLGHEVFLIAMFDCHTCNVTSKEWT